MWQDFQDFLKQPFASDMSALHWFLFIGLLLIISGAWAVILRRITNAV